MTLEQIAESIEDWAKNLGFQDIAITDIDLTAYEPHFLDWLAKGFNGSMGYLNRNIEKRFDPDQLLDGTCRVITARMDYLQENCEPTEVLLDPSRGYVARYALGRDYHKVLRSRLAKLAKKIDSEINPASTYRAFTDSAPILEKPLSEKAGLGWIGKNSLLLNKESGSWFVLGEIFTNLPLPITRKQITNECGQCQACINNCPTGAIIENKQIDARKCISYLTIESKEAIPEDLRPAIGNRIFGCDDCQIYCPWNRPTQTTREPDFMPRHGLQNPDLINLFNWSEETFLQNTEGTALRRINYSQWKRNLAIAIGNGARNQASINALTNGLNGAPELAKEHIKWAIEKLEGQLD